MGNVLTSSSSSPNLFEQAKVLSLNGTAVLEHSEAIQFPPPQDICINMMPFVTNDVTSLPEEHRQYWPLIQRCLYYNRSKGDIGYLTIDERMVKKGESQRRGGLHCESPGVLRVGEGRNLRISWGEIAMRMSCIGGIYMASTVSQSCRVWNAVVKDDSVIGALGDIEHLRPLLEVAESFAEGKKARRSDILPDKNGFCFAPGQSRFLRANHIAWMTDRTPHESFPLSEDTYRQYFRVVTSKITVWYEDHSTKNPLGTVPPPEVIILKGNKFAEIP